MARSTEDIIESLKENISSQDSSLDVTKGPIYNFMCAPVAPVMSSEEQVAERLERLLSLDMVNADDNTDDINAFGNNFKVPRGGGSKEQHLQTFYLYSAPTSDIEIPTGTMVGTENGTYIYKVLSGKTFKPANSTSYYNSTSGRYELNLMVEAIDYGDSYNLPKGRVNKLISTSVRVDGTISATTSLVTGTAEETDSEYLSKTEKRFTGLNSGTDSGIAYTLNDYNGISDVYICKPGDDLFYRKVKRAALDVYINGSNTSCKVQTTTIEVETNKIKLEYSPAVRVESVLVNDKEVDYSFAQDTSNELGGSTSSEDYVVFNDTLEVGSYVSITYYINSDVVNCADTLSEKDLYESDLLTRQSKTAYLNLEIIIKTNTSNKTDAEEQALTALSGYPSYTMGEVLNPSDIEPLMRISVPNVISVYVIKHNIDGQPFEIGTVALPKHTIIDVTTNAVITIL